MKTELTPFNYVENAIRGWWLVVLFISIGVAAGWLIHLTRPEVYQARGTITTSIDFNRTGALSEVQEDQLVGLTEDLMTIPETFNKAAEKARTEGIEIDGLGFRKIAQTDRSYDTWSLLVSHSDPYTAAKLANIWREVSYQELIEAYKHAVIAENLLRYMDSLSSCMEQSVAVDPVTAYCQPGNLEDLLVELDKTGKLAVEERTAAHGISTAILFSAGEPAQVPVRPAQSGKNLLLLGGALIGFLISFLVIPTGVLNRLNWRPRGG